MVNFVIGVLIGAVVYALYRLSELRGDVRELKIQNLLLAERTQPPKREISPPPKPAEESKVAPEPIDPAMWSGTDANMEEMETTTQTTRNRPGSLQSALSKLSNP